VTADQVERKLTAIFAADVEGYSRLMNIDEVATLRTLAAHRVLMDGMIARHRGRIVSTAGDSVLAEFASVVDAVQCAVEVQEALAEANAKEPNDRQMHFRIGVNIGDVLVKDGNIFGDGVNVAARLEAFAEPGGICVSGTVRDHVRNKLPVAFADVGERALKNIAASVRVYRIDRSAATPIHVTPSLALPDKPSIAVLPFTNMSGDPDQEYFADGIAEDIITALSRLRWLFVIARNSTFTYKGRPVEMKQIGRELGVRYVLEGSVRKSSNRVRITAQLIDAETGAHVWAERYDRPLEDIFAVQDEITDTIVATIEPEISASERDRARRKPPEHLGAWELYQRGMWHLLRRNTDELPSSQTCFRDAIALDPNFATPHAALAVSFFFYLTHGLTNEPAATRSDLYEEASKAVALDPRDALGHSALGLGFMERGELAKAISEHQVALSLNPNSAFGCYAFGFTLQRSGQFNDAVGQFSTALRLSPRDPAAWSYLTLKASSLYQLSRYEETIEFARDATRYPVVDLVWPYVHLSAALGQLNRDDEALAAVAELCRRRPGLTISGFRLWPYYRHHRSQKLEQNLEHTIDGLRKAGLPE
jgi:adenylate cyclase